VELETPKEAFTGIYPEGPLAVFFSRDGQRLGIAYLPKWDPGTDGWSPPWDAAAWNLQSGTQLNSTPALKAGLNPETLDRAAWYDGPLVQGLPYTSINDLEEIKFNGYWCVIACEFPATGQALTTHPDGVIRLWNHHFSATAWGHLLRPEVWCALVSGILLLRRALAGRRPRAVQKSLA
jgi:hypothetical protein